MNELERRVLDLAMVRLAEWQGEFPNGIIRDGPRAMHGNARAFIEACIELQKQRQPQPSEKSSG